MVELATPIIIQSIISIQIFLYFNDISKSFI
jgi:hypothetical protein